MGWKQVTLSDDDIIGEKHRAMQDDFTKAFIAAASPPDAGLFIDKETDVYYFSPKAVQIAGTLITRFGGRDCPAPLSTAVDTLVGSRSRADVPFAPEPDV